MPKAKTSRKAAPETAGAAVPQERDELLARIKSLKLSGRAVLTVKGNSCWAWFWPSNRNDAVKTLRKEGWRYHPAVKAWYFRTVPSRSREYHAWDWIQSHVDSAEEVLM